MSEFDKIKARAKGEYERGIVRGYQDAASRIQRADLGARRCAVRAYDDAPMGDPLRRRLHAERVAADVYTYLRRSGGRKAPGLDPERDIRPKSGGKRTDRGSVKVREGGTKADRLAGQILGRARSMAPVERLREEHRRATGKRKRKLREKLRRIAIARGLDPREITR